MHIFSNTRRGFTLIELLIVVLIIGILAAIAIPQYQQAVLKSRFAALMPIAKAISVGNEMYYMIHGQYAQNPADLDVAGKNAAYSDGTDVDMVNSDKYSYVMATRDNNFPMNYIVYQKHSKNFPDNIHCEAANTMAETVCQSLGGQVLESGSLHDGYTTYILKGSASDGQMPNYQDPPACNLANNVGLSCNITTNEDGTSSKEVCTKYAFRIGSANDYRICTTTGYDESNKKLSKTGCVKHKSQNYCAITITATYDELGRVISSSNDQGYSVSFTYDDEDKVQTKTECTPLSSLCSAYKYTYGLDGSLASVRIESDPNHWRNYVFTYNSDGSIVEYRTWNQGGNTGSYTETYLPEEITYDVNGNLSLLGSRQRQTDGEESVFEGNTGTEINQGNYLIRNASVSWWY